MEPRVARCREASVARLEETLKMRSDHSLVYARPVWIPPTHGRAHDQACWFVSALPGRETGIIRLSDLPDRYCLVSRLEQVAGRRHPSVVRVHLEEK